MQIPALLLPKRGVHEKKPVAEKTPALSNNKNNLRSFNGNKQKKASISRSNSITGV